MEGIGVDDLYWLDADGCKHSAFNTTLFELGLYDIKVFDATSFFCNEAIMSNISKNTSSANKVGWEHTQWTSRNLLANGFELVDRNTICAVDDGEGRAFIVCIYTRGVNATTLTDFADYVLNTRGAVHKHVAGQSIVHKRGSKKQDGHMLMYGTHNLFGINATHEGLSPHWQPAAYLPSGERDELLYTKLRTLAAHMSALEKSFTPIVADVRRRLFDHMDPKKRHRITDGCNGPALSITIGYVVGPHDDSGVSNEAILFTNRDGPMPAGHAWLFAIAGTIFVLPNVRSEAVHITIAPEIYHGTLPTSSVLPHLVHGNVASALVTRKDLAMSFAKQARRGDETPTRLTASHIYQST